MMNKDSIDVVVVGVGFAGIQAATKLQSQGKNVLLLEASDCVGGCASSTLDSVDLGCTFIGKKHEHAVQLTNSLGLPLIDYAETAPKDPAF